jgi:hypothetical protein
MRILVGNQIDDAIRMRKDIRSWVQRTLWFAQDEDLIVLPTPPDEAFLRHVASLTGVDPASLTFQVPPAGRFGGRLMDPHSLTDAEFLRNVAKSLGEVTEVFALWPSADVARFAARLGLYDRMPGAAFFEQGAGEIVNSKANFRAFAAACGVPTAPGEVCRAALDAERAMERLLDGTGAVVVKQAHNGAGAGNQIVVRDETLLTSHAGGMFLHHLGPGADAVRHYWKQRWAWASTDGRFPVVVEEFTPGGRTVYAEFHAGETEVELMEVGTLVYVDRQLTREILPYRGIAEQARSRLVGLGRKLAEYYWSLGYRGYLSPDAVLTPDDRLIFTEVNSQVTGSTHLYRGIAHRVADVHRAPLRTVLQHRSSPEWAVTDLAGFLAGAKDAGCLYDPATRSGVIPSVPIIPGVTDKGFLFSTVYGAEDEQRAIYRMLDERFRRG